jgi:hypothetical protein
LKGRERWKWDGEKKMVENGLCSSLTNREVAMHTCMKTLVKICLT